MKNLLKIKKEAIEENIPIIMDDTLKVIYDYYKDRKAFSILEIGSAVGYSALCFLDILDCNGVIDTIERDHNLVIKAKSNFKKLKAVDRINIYEGDAVDILPNLDKKYDMVFIDAAKGKYPFFLEHALRLLNSNGIIFADNVLYKGYVMSNYNKHKQRTAVTHLREFIKLATENELLDTKILEVGDGLAIIRFK